MSPTCLRFYECLARCIFFKSHETLVEAWDEAGELPCCFSMCLFRSVTHSGFRTVEIPMQFLLLVFILSDQLLYVCLLRVVYSSCAEDSKQDSTRDDQLSRSTMAPTFSDRLINHPEL